MSRFPLLLATRGLPGSGKSTWAIETAEMCPPGQVKTVCLDDLRNSFDRGHWSKANEQLVQDAQIAYVTAAIEAGHDVIVHNTHVHARSVNRLRRETAMLCTLAVVDFPTPIELCKERDARREGRAQVGPEVIDRMAKGLQSGARGWTGHGFLSPESARAALLSEAPSPVVLPQYQPDTDLPIAAVVDLDGTLAKHNGRDPYDASRCGEDLFDQTVWTAATAFPHVVFLSGREEKYRPETENWLLDHVGAWQLSSVTRSGVGPELHMRATDDRRPDSIVKHELFMNRVAPRYNVKLSFDDRGSVVRMWRRLGVPCFQVADGNF